MRIAPPVVLTGEQRAKLETYARGRGAQARVVLRARIVLLAGEGKQDLKIAHRLSIVPRTAARWRSRFLHDGIAGLEHDAPRPGRTPSISPELVRMVIAKTTQERPSHATHWSTRTMAAVAGISEASVRRIWHSHGLKPHRVETFKLSNDPRFAEKLEDIVGLYLNPPEHALVLSLDEKSQIQALDRTQPGLPMKKGRAHTMTHDYKRHGTTTLFAALNTLDGSVMATCMERHRHQEWLKFLRLIDRQTPADKQLHLIVDNYATHKHAKVKAWLARHPRFHLHFTPTGSSWLNLVERFFRDLSQQALVGASFGSIPELVDAIWHYLAEHNLRPKRYVWRADGQRVREKIRRAWEAAFA
jgi:transposase